MFLRRKRRLIFLIIAAILLISSATFLIKYRNVRYSATALTCIGRLSNIKSAMDDYHQKYGCYPPSVYISPEGHSHSWRILLLEFIDEEKYAKYRFGEPWNGPNNRNLESQRPKFYSCPGNSDSESKFKSDYFVVVGNGTVFQPNRKVTRDDITREHEKTILIVESSDVNIHWMEPRDIPLETICQTTTRPDLSQLKSRNDNGPHCCMVDGTKIRISRLSDEEFCASLTIAR